MPMIEVNDITLAYFDTGPPLDVPDAATIVFGHGTLFGSWMFHHQIEALRESYRCIAIDWRGHGDTPATTHGYDMDILTADAVGLIEKLDFAPVHWVGLSTGGFVGQRLAARHGELLRSLVLLDTSACAERQRVIRRNRLLAVAFGLTGATPLGPLVAPVMFGPTFRADPAGRQVIAEWLRRLNRCDRRGIVEAIHAAMGRASVEAELSAITVPTLVAVGADDIATPPRQARHMADLILGARFETIPDSGHCSTLEQPAAVTRLLFEFIRSADSIRH